ncbi:hypothetical protein D3C85_1612010 [compost metagenome]
MKLNRILGGRGLPDQERRNQTDQEQEKADGTAVAEVKTAKCFVIHIRSHHFTGSIRPAVRHDIDQVKVFQGTDNG